MKIACRTGFLGPVAEAFAALRRCKVDCAEVGAGADTDFAALKAAADAAGVTITTLATGVNLDLPASREALVKVIEGAASIGTRRIFCSFSSRIPESSAPILHLRDILARAAACEVYVCLETHPPFGTNAAVARRTLTAVNSPWLRYNFDTGNIYYYNHGLDAVEQLRLSLDLVGSLHLKDTDGTYHGARFPVLGTGVVDFPAVFKMLREAGFAGPCTMEPEGEALDHHEAGKEDFLRLCAGYLRRIHAAG